MAPQLTKSQIRFLRKQVHSYKCIVTVGNAGLSEAVLNEAENSLAHHELMKIKINAGDQLTRKKIAQQICTSLGASLVLSIGHVIAIYRPATRPVIVLPS